MSGPKQHAVEIVRRLRERGYQGYFAGGCVRDLLLSREPADYDVATDATPRQVMQIFPQTYAVGEQFGVVLVPIKATTTEDTENHGGKVSQDDGTECGRVIPGTAGGSAALRYLFLAPSLKSSVEVATFR